MPIEKVEKIWFNGEMVDWDKAQVHVLSHALHYGSGVFEGIRAYETPKGPAIFRLTEHIERLMDSSKIYLMPVPYSVEQLVEATKELVRVNKLKSSYIRPIIFRGYGEMGLNPLNSPVDVAIATWSWGTYLGDEGMKNGIKAMISSFRRIDPNSLPPAAKATGQYINSILAKLEAIYSNYEEAILLDSRGFVSEGTGENIFVVKNGVIHTPSTAASILEGITRDTVIELARDMGYEVIERDLVRSDLFLADELFVTGTAAEITPIREVDKREIGKPGPVTIALQEKFFAAVKGEDAKYEHWLEYV
ncbi:MAG TPA: branched chain amino acid aminotransferase [Actinobacteria bacterium]|nr:branched chain amino acid aminotransferase [Actinomycetota bacterium]